MFTNARAVMFPRQFCLFKKLTQCYSTKVSVVSSKSKPVEIPRITLHEYLWKNLDKWPERTATVCFETNRSYTYHQLYKKSQSVARFLTNSIKLQKLDTVGVVLSNVPEYPIIVLGATQAGLKVTTCNPNYTSNEIQKQFVNSQPKLVFTSRALLPIVQQAVGNLNKNVPIVEITDGDGFTNGTISFKEISSGKGDNPVNVDVDETVLLLYSSGTTGLPKGVQLSHFNIVSNLTQVASPEFNFINSEEQDIIPVFLPIFHIYGLIIILFNCMTMGAKLVTMPTFSTENFIKLLKNYKPSVIYGVPLNVIMANNNPNIQSEDLACIRTFMSAAAPLGGSDVEKFRAKTKNNVNIIQGYGMTETSVTIIQSLVLENGIKTGGSGFLVPNTDAKIISLDESTEGLGPNQPGELIIRGPQVMQGYFNNPLANKEIFPEGGWIKTGDIAYYDHDEHFYITDRLKELIKVKGFPVAPAELEEILRTHPDVDDVAVVGIPHSVQGEAPKAFVVTKPGVKPPNLEEFVAAKVARYKRLTGGVVFVNTIPKSASGKILRRELKKM